jgi:hypothetical protein
MTFQEIRNRANRVRGIPLQAVLIRTGASRDRYDKAKWHTTQGTISCIGAKFMNWNQNAGGGGAIDLAMHLNNLDFKAAVEWLCRHFPDFDEAEQSQSFATTDLILPPQDRKKLPAVLRYLTNERGIAPLPIQALIESGRLYADNRSNAVFLLLDKEKKPVGAELRGTTQARWRGMAPGSRKDIGYFSMPNLRTKSIVLCESAIDAISCSILHPEHLCISTSGSRPNPRWLPSLIHQEYVIYCGFDSDSTGDNMANTMIALHPSIKRLRPALHDWNDVLLRVHPFSSFGIALLLP